MARFIKRITASKHKIPGTIEFIGKKKVDKADITLFNYNQTDLIEKELTDISESLVMLSDNDVSWININGLHDVDLLSKTSQTFNLHPLLIEDVANTHNTSTLQIYDDHLFLSIKMIEYDSSKREFSSEQLSLVIGANYVISFQERPGDCFSGVRDRLRSNLGRIRKMKSDYLAYALINAILSNYIEVSEKLGLEIDEIESQVMTNTDRDVLKKINDYKVELIYLKRHFRPVKENLLLLLKAENNIIRKETKHFYKDLQEISVAAIEAIENYNTLLSEMLNIYNTMVSLKLNDIIKFLTIFSTIFIPLTFIAGIYGTNFQYFPELGYKYAYPIFWILLIVIAIGMIFYFKRKKWL